MSETPTLEEIIQAHHAICYRQTNCKECEFVNYANYNMDECKIAFAYDVLTGKRDLDGALLESWLESRESQTPETEEKPKLPKWCKVGQWVSYNADTEHRLGKILVIDDENDPRIRVEAHSTFGFDTPEEESISIRSVFYPVRFLPYTDDEAMKLLGKVFTFSNTGHALMLTGYKPNRCAPYILDGYGYSYLELVSVGVTIDGVPIGVPEMDEEAMKGCEV